MKREDILQEIRRLAVEAGGKPPGQERFTTQTGIRKADWLGRYWARWSDALKEAGMEPNRFYKAIPDDFLLQKLTDFVREIGHFPVEAELRLKARADPTFPDHTTFGTRLGNRATRAAKLRAYCLKNGFLEIAALCPEIPQREPEEEHRAIPPLNLGTVYLLKTGKFYKIGRTNSVGRRERELSIQLPERAKLVHAINTDDPVGIESYWHNRFSERRANGEWFALSQEDVQAFCRRKFM